MFRSLWFRLMGALVAVTVVVLAVMTGTTRVIIMRQFDVYSSRSGEIWAAQIAPFLAERYRQDGNWSQAQAALANPWRASPIGQTPNRLGPMIEQPGHMGPPPGEAGDMWRTMDIHLLLVDTNGVIVADSQNALRGAHINPEIAESGTPVTVNDVQVGTLVAVPTDVNNRAQITLSFLSAVTQSEVLAALAAGAAALVVGTWLFWLITKPVSDMRKAVQTIEAGQLGARVPVKGHDELATLGHAFNQMAARLEKQQQLRKQMVADVAHDLRTPLSVMQGTIEAMEDGVLKVSGQELKNLHHEVRQLTHLVEDLRTLSLADEGQLQLDLRSVDIRTMIEQIVQSRLTLAEARHIRLETDITPLLEPIRADEDRLVQVVNNILENALRHTPDGGSVRVEASQAGSETTIRVRDTGAGIRAEDIPFVFERFWRSDRARSRESGGSGIGLAIARQIIELHKGTIRVESNMDKGSVFTIMLPTQPTT